MTLARRAPSVAGFEELVETVWAGTAVSDETLTQRVALLRRALGDEAKNPRYLRAVRGRGYQLVPEVRTVAEEEISRPAPPPKEIGWRRIGAVAAAAVALVVLGIAVWPSFLHRTDAAVPVITRSPGVPELLTRAGTYLSLQQEPNNRLAIELYQRALQREPENPLALAGLSLALGQRVTKFNVHAEASDRALELARRAVALEPELGRAHHALGLGEGLLSGGSDDRA